MKINTVPSKWVLESGYRLDAAPFLSGAFQARVTLKTLKIRMDPLASLASGHAGGIYNGPQFSRRWVATAEHGVPFVGSSSMLMAELSDLPFLRKKDAYSSKLSFLRMEQGMTLISCSGTIGRMVYARPDMEGMWSSQDVMKVVPNPERILPGYLFAYLSCRFGSQLITSRTYGAIIQHIEPEHIADLPVPRLGDIIEKEAHNMVEEAAHSRTRANTLLAESQQEVMSFLGGWEDDADKDVLPWSEVPASSLTSRSDAYYFSAKCLAARRAFDTAKNCDVEPLESYAQVFIPGIFKRLYADDPQFGCPYITGADVFQIAPTSERYLLKRVAEEYGLVVKKGIILIQEAGQLGGLVGKSVAVGSHLDGFAVSNNMVRVAAHDPEETGYLFAVLASKPGEILIAREAAGSSIPHIDANRVRQIRIPWAKASVRVSVGKKVIEARDLRDNACEKEQQARSLVESAIEGEV